MNKVNTYFEQRLPSMYRVPTVKQTSDKGFCVNNKMFASENDANLYKETRQDAVGVFEITHVYGDKGSLIANHEYTYRGFVITNFDRTSDEIASGKKVQYLMVDIMAVNPNREFHGYRESLGLALDYIDSYLYKIKIGKIKVKRKANTKPTIKQDNKRYIIIHTNNNGTNYLAWQKPAWDESGYFWTSRKTFMKILCNSTNEHPFLFNTEREAYTWLRLSGITARCRITTIKINKSTKLNDPIMDGYAYPGISADIGFV